MNPNTGIARLLKVADSITIDRVQEPLLHYSIEVYKDGEKMASAKAVSLTGAIGVANRNVDVPRSERKPRAVKTSKPVPVEAPSEFIVPTPEQEAIAAKWDENWDRVAHPVAVGEGDE
jgi:hypothetical protein